MSERVRGIRTRICQDWKVNEWNKDINPFFSWRIFFPESMWNWIEGVALLNVYVKLFERVKIMYFLDFITFQICLYREYREGKKKYRKKSNFKVGTYAFTLWNNKIICNTMFLCCISLILNTYSIYACSLM